MSTPIFDALVRAHEDPFFWEARPGARGYRPGSFPFDLKPHGRRDAVMNPVDDFPCCTLPGHFVQHADGTLDAFLHEDTDPHVLAKRDPWWVG